MIRGNAELLPLVKDMVYLPRGVSDHSLLVVSVNLGGGWTPKVLEAESILAGANGRSRGGNNQIRRICGI